VIKGTFVQNLYFKIHGPHEKLFHIGKSIHMKKN